MKMTFTNGDMRSLFDSIAAFETLPDVALVDLKTVMALSCRSKSSVYRDIAAQRLSKPIQIGMKSVRWRVIDVRNYLSGNSQ
jgi:predicted DNA-binding transcriptional regulator AlpA